MKSGNPVRFAAAFRLITNINDGASWALDGFAVEKANGELPNDATAAAE